MSFGSMKWDFTAKSKRPSSLSQQQQQQQRQGENLFSTTSSSSAKKINHENPEAGRPERASNGFFTPSQQQSVRNSVSSEQHKRHFRKQDGRQLAPRKSSSRALVQLSHPNANAEASNTQPKKTSFSLKFNATPQKRTATHKATGYARTSARIASEQGNVSTRPPHSSFEARSAQQAANQQEQEEAENDEFGGDDDGSDAEGMEDGLDPAADHDNGETVEEDGFEASLGDDGGDASSGGDHEQAHRQSSLRGYENLASALPRGLQENGGLQEIATKAEDLQSGLDHIHNSDSSAGALEELLSDYDNHIKSMPEIELLLLKTECQHILAANRLLQLFQPLDVKRAIDFLNEHTPQSIDHGVSKSTNPVSPSPCESKTAEEQAASNATETCTEANQKEEATHKQGVGAASASQQVQQEKLC